jgi:hypothetical protein
LRGRHLAERHRLAAAQDPDRERGEQRPHGQAPGTATHAPVASQPFPSGGGSTQLGSLGSQIVHASLQALFWQGT